MRSAPLPLVLLLGLLAAAPAWADNRRPSLQEQEAQALARLSLPDLRNYFEGRRQIERKSSDQRIAQLRSLEDCLERTRQRSDAGVCLEQARRQRERQRSQWAREMVILRQRYQLPTPGQNTISQEPSSRFRLPQPWQEALPAELRGRP